MRSDLEATIRRIAGQQHGVLSRSQAHAAGATDQDLRRALATPGWDELSSQVLVVVGSAATPAQQCMAAVLDAGDGAVLSHHSAASLWGLPGFDLRTLHVTRPRPGTHRPSQLAVVHEVRGLDPTHVTTLDGIPVTTGARLIVDLVGLPRFPEARAARTLDNMLARRISQLEVVRSMSNELGGRGRRGTVLLRELLLARPPGYIPPASGLEARFLSLVREADIPEPERQLDVGGDRWLGRIDFTWLDVLALFELDSDLHHRQKVDADADKARDRALLAAGWLEVGRAREHDVWHRPREVIANVRAVRRRAARRLAA